MMDRKRRDQYAEQLRHFAAGVLTVNEYESRTEDLDADTADPALPAVWKAIRQLYDDFGTDRLRGEDKLDAATRKQVTRTLLFLYSDTDYAWPDDKRHPVEYLESGVHCLLNAVTLGMWRHLIDPIYERRWRERQWRLQQFGDVDCWPFLRRADLEKARQTPRFFTGIGPQW